MKHFPIIENAGERNFIEFSHFDQDAICGLWTKDNKIVWNHIKINVFLEGSFSVFSDGVLHYPAYGDICVLSPMKMHYGQITESMHINYYQIDIGLDSLASIPGGNRLIEQLISTTSHRDSFLRPDNLIKETIIQLCRKIEAALKIGELPLAYAKTIELLSAVYPLYACQSGTANTGLSLRTTQIMRYIERNYSQSITRDHISKELGVSSSFLSRIFKKELGISVVEYLNRYRILKAISLLQDHSVTEAGYLCGFCDTSHFISVFKKHVGETPLHYVHSLCGNAEQRVKDDF